MVERIALFLLNDRLLQTAQATLRLGGLNALEAVLLEQEHKPGVGECLRDIMMTVKGDGDGEHTG